MTMSDVLFDAREAIVNELNDGALEDRYNAGDHRNVGEVISSMADLIVLFDARPADLDELVQFCYDAGLWGPDDRRLTPKGRLVRHMLNDWAFS